MKGLRVRTTRRRVRALAVIPVIASLGTMAGCGDSDDAAGDPPPALTERGKSFDLTIGDDVMIVLESNISTGFRWELAETPRPDVVEFVGETYLEPDAELVGAPGRQALSFRGIGEGTALISLWYIRAQDAPIEPADLAEFQVVVADPSGAGSGSGGDQGPITVSDLLDRADSITGDVTVPAVLFDGGSGVVMCEALAESFPPQCPGRSVPIRNPDVLDVQFTEESGIRWTDQVVELTGRMLEGGFEVVEGGDQAG